MFIYMIVSGIIFTTLAVCFFIASLVAYRTAPSYRKKEAAMPVRVTSILLALAPFGGVTAPLIIGMGIVYGIFKAGSTVWAAWHEEAPKK